MCDWDFVISLALRDTEEASRIKKTMRVDFCHSEKYLSTIKADKCYDSYILEPVQSNL